MKTNRRHAFTLVELLIVIAIIGTLVGLLLPAINAAREAARRTQCVNNQKEIATSILNYQTSSTGNAYPSWRYLERLSPTAADQWADTPRPDMAISWAAKLLPQLDQGGLWDSIREGRADLTKLPRQEIYLCPSDVRTNETLPHLTYVANTGCPDIRTDPSDLAANGLFHDQLRNGPVVKDIQDGAATTLMLSENIHKDDAGLGILEENSWLRSSVWNGGQSTEAEQPFGMVWVYDRSNWQAPAISGMQEAFSRNDRDATTFFDKGFAFARPASAHPNVFVAAMAGGSVQEINNDIEYRVYQQLMTPNGSKCEYLWDPNVDLGSVAPPFRNIGVQLSDSDF